MAVVQYTFTHRQYTEQHENVWKISGRAQSLRVISWHLPYSWGKSTEKPVRLAEECQLARWKQNTQNRTYITIRICRGNSVGHNSIYWNRCPLVFGRNRVSGLVWIGLERFKVNRIKHRPDCLPCFYPYDWFGFMSAHTKIITIYVGFHPFYGPRRPLGRVEV